jgi:hypothetical protein
MLPPTFTRVRAGLTDEIPLLPSAAGLEQLHRRTRAHPNIRRRPRLAGPAPHLNRAHQGPATTRPASQAEVTLTYPAGQDNLPRDLLLC